MNERKIVRYYKSFHQISWLTKKINVQNECLSFGQLHLINAIIL